MFKCENSESNCIEIQDTIYLNRFICNLDIYIQTYGRKKDKYIQAATEEKMIRILEEILIDDAIQTVFIDSLFTIPRNTNIERLIRFLNIKGKKIFVMRF